jgi:hypothetical protein
LTKIVKSRSLQIFNNNGLILKNNGLSSGGFPIGSVANSYSPQHGELIGFKIKLSRDQKQNLFQNKIVA